MNCIVRFIVNNMKKCLISIQYKAFLLWEILSTPPIIIIIVYMSLPELIMVG